jgi:murein DD-endopeptidase MepM/ murein hydrolase activator NlpD
MVEIIDCRRGLAAAANLIAIAGLLTACAPGPSGPAPVYIGGTGPTAVRPPLAMTTGSPPPKIAKTALPPMAKGPPPRIAKTTPDVIPLDSSPPVPHTTAEPPPLASAPAPSATLGISGGRFPWPVHGRILASYGSANGGPHNEGINIAAPLGTPVRTIDAGTVAYVGNEVKGYGNLVLIKHANGWISAYAHLDGIAVKKGDSVAAGQVIAKVGDTGGVGEPQLHFELRRGTKPVDPKEFLEPAAKAT